MEIIITKSDTVYSKQDQYSLKIEQSIYKQIRENPPGKSIVVDICFLDAPKPQRTNYIDLQQNTAEWHQERQFKITDSRLPYLVGLHGQNKFLETWDIVKTGKNESEKFSGIRNIQRGRFFERTAISYFEKVSKSTSQVCGFFRHPSNNRYGASPDALGAAGFLLEVKTRAENSDGPLKSLESFPHYYYKWHALILIFVFYYHTTLKPILVNSF